MASAKGAAAAKQEVYTWRAPWDVHNVAASARTDSASAFRYACGSYSASSFQAFGWEESALVPRVLHGSFNTNPILLLPLRAIQSPVEDYSNKVAIIQLDEEKDAFVVRSTMDHPYPTTRIQWAPESMSDSRDLLATSGDYLRLWHVQGDGEVKQECVFKNVREQRGGGVRPGLTCAKLQA